VEEQLLDMALPEDSSAPAPEDLSEETAIFGREGFLDSLSLVTVVLSIEQQVNDEYGVTITIADDRAMSQRHSPFRTIGSLADYVSLLVAEARGTAGTTVAEGEAPQQSTRP
jgi:acyl carrier protein